MGRGKGLPQQVLEPRNVKDCIFDHKILNVFITKRNMSNWEKIFTAFITQRFISKKPNTQKFIGKLFPFRSK